MKSPILKIARECDSYDNKYSIYRQIMAIGKKNRSEVSSINNIARLSLSPSSAWLS